MLTSSQELGLVVRLTKHFGRASGGAASSRAAPPCFHLPLVSPGNISGAWT